MVIRKLKDCPPFIADDHSLLRELLHPDKSELNIRYSLAHAVVKPGGITVPHRLKTSEVYYVIEGIGIMRIDGEKKKVCPGDAVYIPPGALQNIRNSGKKDLKFLCIVDPAWRKENEEIIEGEDRG